mgnify:FL=1|jgi:hypothetical protein
MSPVFIRYVSSWLFYRICSGLKIQFLQFDLSEIKFPLEHYFSKKFMVLLGTSFLLSLLSSSVIMILHSAINSYRSEIAILRRFRIVSYHIYDRTIAMLVVINDFGEWLKVL